MDVSTFEYKMYSFAQNTVQILAGWSYDYFILSFAIITGLMIIFGISPLSSTGKTTSFEMLCIWIRKGLFIVLMALFSVVFFTWFFIFVSNSTNNAFDAAISSVSYHASLLESQWYLLVSVLIFSMLSRLIWSRWCAPFLSELWRQKRHQQTTETASDIKTEIQTYRQKNFIPSDYYEEHGLFIGLDENEQPDYIPLETWREINMQVIGPSRYGKGVLLGCLMDQIIQKGDGLVYVDPKADHWAPHLLFQAAKASNRQFYFLALHDDQPGSWAPFEGGSIREAQARLEMAFGLDYTGNPGTDFYKSQEKAELESALSESRSLKGLAQALLENPKTLRINAELKRWSEVTSLCPIQGKGFSIEKAIQENAVVYVQGSLDDPVVTTATKVLIAEYVQISRKLFKQGQRQQHLTMVIDEVSFLASQTLARSLATSVGFHVNFVLAYQSPSDLLNVDDKTVDPRYLLQSITINSQVKVTYGGTDKDAAELASKLSGTTTKTLTRSEMTEVDVITGGETWTQGRSIMQQEVPLIHVNTMYALPPRVCAFFQPRSLAQIRYTSHVPVQDLTSLPMYLKTRFSRSKDGLSRKEKQKQRKREDKKDVVGVKKLLVENGSI